MPIDTISTPVKPSNPAITARTKNAITKPNIFLLLLVNKYLARGYVTEYANVKRMAKLM